MKPPNPDESCMVFIGNRINASPEASDAGCAVFETSLSRKKAAMLALQKAVEWRRVA